MDPNDEKPNKTTRPPKRLVWTFPTTKPETATSESITSDLQAENLPSNEDLSTVLHVASTSSAATTETPDVKPHSVIVSDAVPAKGNVDFKFIGPAIVQASINNPVLMPELVLRPSEEAILKLQEKTPKPQKRKFKTAGPTLDAKSTSDIALAHFPTDEQNALHKNSSSKTRNSKCNEIGPAIVQATLSHPFAWLKDFKALDEISMEKTRIDSKDSNLNENPTEATTSTDPKPGPSNINRNQCLQPPLKILVKSAELNETNSASKINVPSSFADGIESSATLNSETVINFIDPLQGGSLPNQSGENALGAKNKPKKRKFKTAMPVVVAPSTCNNSLVNFPTNEQSGLSELHENVSSKRRKSKNSKFNAIGPAIVQGTLSHPIAWLKDFKPLDELSVPSKNLLDPANAETKHNLQPGPSRGNENQSVQSIHKKVAKSAERNNPKNSPKLNKQLKAKLKQKQKATSQFANSNESSLTPRTATIINFTDPLQDASVQNESNKNVSPNTLERIVNNTSDQTAMQNGPEQHTDDHMSLFSRIVHWNPNPEHPLVKCLENSGIPGLNESVKQDLHICTRLYWVAAFCFILAFCIIILMWGTGKFNEHPLKVDLVPTEFFTSDIPFPTTTSSLTKSYKKTELHEIGRAAGDALLEEYDEQFKGKTWSLQELLGLMFIVDEVALSTRSLSGQLRVSEFQRSSFHKFVQAVVTDKKFSLVDDPENLLFYEKIVPVMKMGMIKCKELILKCSWNGKTEDCLKMIRSYFSSIGIACSFNLASDSATRRDKTVKSLFEEPIDDDEGKQWEKLNMDEYFESLYKKSTKFINGTITLPLTQKVAGDSYGFSQLLYAKKGEYSYSQLDADGFMINLSPLFGDPNIDRYGFAVPFNQEIFVAIIPEITLANPEIYKIDAMERGCYNSTEFHLDFYKHYTMENCLSEMLAKDILVVCNCSSLSGPKSSNKVICNYKQRRCAADVERDVYERSPSIVYKQCLPSCSNIVYRYEISYLAYSEKDPPDYVKDQNLDNDTVTSLIHVFMKDRTVIGKVRDVKYETFDKVGLLGGIFGFTSGIALINLAYLVLAIVICIFSIRKWRQRSAARKLAVAASLTTPSVTAETGNTRTNEVLIDETSSNFNPQTEIPP